jgi:uncharacterized protein
LEDKLMAHYQLGYQEGMDESYSVASANASVRAAFMRSTYLHLAGAVLAFVGIEAALFASGLAGEIIKKLFLSIPFAWVGLMVLFIVGGMGAQYLARSSFPRPMQYVGLGLYVLLEVLIFLPLLYIAEARFPGQYLPIKAGLVTLVTFLGLTIAVVMSGKDFSFLGPVLWTLSFLALGVVIASLIFGFSMGIIFPAFMVMLACGFIIYDTSNIVHHFRPDQDVAAALELFASVTLLFWYVLRLYMMTSSSD